FQLLLELGADPNIVFDDGGTVMHWTAEHQDLGFLRAALEAGGNPNLAAGQDGRSPLYAALGSNDAMDLLVAAGADINYRLAGIRVGPALIGAGNTPLHVAARR